MTNARVLVVGNGTALNELVDSGLAQRGFNVKCKTSAEAALSVLDTDDFEVLLTDAHTEGMSGLELCKEALRRKPDLCVIITNQNGNLEHAIEAIRAGAYDLVTQPFTKDALA